MMERLFSSSAPLDETLKEEDSELGDDMKLTSIQSITDFITCAGRTLPDNIRLWARRNLAVAKSHEVIPGKNDATGTACAFYYDEYPVEDQIILNQLILMKQDVS